MSSGQPLASRSTRRNQQSICTKVDLMILLSEYYNKTHLYENPQLNVHINQFCDSLESASMLNWVVVTLREAANSAAGITNKTIFEIIEGFAEENQRSLTEQFNFFLAADWDIWYIHMGNFVGQDWYETHVKGPIDTKVMVRKPTFVPDSDSSESDGVV